MFILNDLLCFLQNKFSCKQRSVLKSTVIDFFNVDDVSKAKQQLVNDVEVLSLPQQLPHIPARRDNDQRLIREVDDIFTVFTHLDEMKCLDNLPRYVSSGPDGIPSVRIYENDLKPVIEYMQKLERELIELRAVVAAIGVDVHSVHQHVQFMLSSRAANFNSLSSVPPRGPRVSQSTGQLATAPTGLLNSGNSTTNHSVSENETNLKEIMQPGVFWADVVATTGPSHGRQRDLPSITDNSQDDMSDNQEADGFTYHLTRKQQREQRKRQRVSSDNSAGILPTSTSTRQLVGGQQQRPQNIQAQQRRRGATRIIGKSTSPSRQVIIGAAAVPARVEKIVFCVDNLSLSTTANDMRQFVTNMGVNVQSCFPTKPRRRGHDDTGDDRRAFRLCIAKDDTERFLIADSWPVNVVISDWYHKPTRDVQQRQQQNNEQSHSSPINVQQTNVALHAEVHGDIDVHSDVNDFPMNFGEDDPEATVICAQDGR